jgi:hypothetical protein
VRQGLTHFTTVSSSEPSFCCSCGPCHTQLCGFMGAEGEGLIPIPWGLWSFHMYQGFQPGMTLPKGHMAPSRAFWHHPKREARLFYPAVHRCLPQESTSSSMASSVYEAESPGVLTCHVALCPQRSLASLTSLHS